MSARAGDATVGRIGGRSRVKPRAAILAIVVTALLIYLVVPLRSFMAQRAQLDRLARQTTALHQQNAELHRQIARLRDPAYLERIARECLGMVKRGEIAFVIVPKDGKARPPTC